MSANYPEFMSENGLLLFLTKILPPYLIGIKESYLAKMQNIHKNHLTFWRWEFAISESESEIFI